MGDDWYLPAKSEMELIFGNLSKVNSALESLGCKVFGGYDYYWSSTECDDCCARPVDVSYGYTGNDVKNFNYHVRAVSAF